MKKLTIVLRVLGFLICAMFVVPHCLLWLSSRIEGTTIEIPLYFWVGLGLTGLLLTIAEEIKGRAKRENQTH